MANLFCVKDKVVIITGGAGILGKGIAGYLAEEGAKVVILDVQQKLANKLLLKLKQKAEKLVSS
jgi:NAD(P)-dependent dehydrogenase (short-subunit alcohol dehydrogenase family)